MKATSSRDRLTLKGCDPGTSDMQVSVLGRGCEIPMVKGSCVPWATPPLLQQPEYGKNIPELHSPYLVQLSQQPCKVKGGETQAQETAV